MVDFTKLVVQGRAYSALRAWSPEELEALLTLERERGLSRSVAADFIRNGIMTLEAYDAAEAAKFKPKTLVEAAAEAEAALKANDFATTPEVDPTPEEVAPTPEVETAPVPTEEETAPEPETTEEAPKKGKK